MILKIVEEVSFKFVKKLENQIKNLKYFYDPSDNGGYMEIKALLKVCLFKFRISFHRFCQLNPI